MTFSTIALPMQQSYSERPITPRHPLKHIHQYLTWAFPSGGLVGKIIELVAFLFQPWGVAAATSIVKANNPKRLRP